MMYSKQIPKILSLALVVFLGGVLVVHAYEPLAKLPIGGTGGTTGYESMGTYLEGMIKFMIALGGVISIVIAIIGGVQRIASGISPSAKSDANKRIENALVGLALVLTSYLILKSINPNLVKLNLDLEPVKGEQRATSTMTRITTSYLGIGCPNTVKFALLSETENFDEMCAQEKAEKATTPTDPIIKSLSPTAQAAAIKLKSMCPSVQFESGRRDVSGQAIAMAKNIISTGQYWIKTTYAQSTSRTKLQESVDNFFSAKGEGYKPSKEDTSSISSGLIKIMNDMTDSERALISKHFSGDAFDVKISSDMCVLNALKSDSLPGKTKFLDKEGEPPIYVWHAEF